MAAENIDWHAHIHQLMTRKNVTHEEIKDFYSSWGKVYEKVSTRSLADQINFDPCLHLIQAPLNYLIIFNTLF